MARSRLITGIGTGIAVAGLVHVVANLRQLRTLPTAPPRERPRVSVLIPARNEAEVIGYCLRAVRAQNYGALDIVVFDDQSSDGTRQVVEQHVHDERVQLLVSEGEPPQGWLGKAYACQSLAAYARGDLLVFLDADVLLTPDAISRIVAMFDGGEVDAVSPYPRQVAVTWAERLVQPLLQWSWATLLPLRLAEQSSSPALVAANGQLLAVTRTAYEDIGGHAAVRADVLDDIALFKRLKCHGRRALLADGTEVARCRMYVSWEDLQAGYTKSLSAALPSPTAAAGFAAFAGLAYVVPAIAAVRGSKIGLTGYVAAVCSRVLVASRVRGRIWPDSALHPVSVLLFCYLLARSHIGRRRRTLQWKGRRVVLD